MRNASITTLTSWRSRTWPRRGSRRRTPGSCSARVSLLRSRAHRRGFPRAETQRLRDAARRALAVLHRGHHELAARRVATHPDLGVAGAPRAGFGLHASPGVGLHARERLSQRAERALPDRHHGQLARELATVGEPHGLELPALAHERRGRRALDQAHALPARVPERVRVAAHVRLGAAVEHRHVGHAQLRQLAGGVDGGVAAADHDRVLHPREREAGRARGAAWWGGFPTPPWPARSPPAGGMRASSWSRSTPAPAPVRWIERLKLE